MSGDAIDVRVLEAPTVFRGASRPVGARMLHLFASFAPDPAGQATFVDPEGGPQFFRDCEAAPPGLWQITTTAVNYVRDAGEGTLLPLPFNAGTVVPAGVAPFTRRTPFQLRVFANDGVDLRRFDMDANQSLAIVAQDVCIHWIGPPGSQDVSSATGTPLDGLVVDTFLGVALSRIEHSPGANSTAILTRHLFVPAGEQASIEIPPYASDVTIYQEPTLGVASVMWTQCLGDPLGIGGSMTMGALPFIAGARRTQQESVMPNVTHLLSDITPEIDGNRFFTLRFLIRP